MKKQCMGKIQKIKISDRSTFRFVFSSSSVNKKKKCDERTYCNVKNNMYTQRSYINLVNFGMNYNGYYKNNGYMIFNSSSLQAPFNHQVRFLTDDIQKYEQFTKKSKSHLKGNLLIGYKHISICVHVRRYLTVIMRCCAESDEQVVHVVWTQNFIKFKERIIFDSIF